VVSRLAGACAEGRVTLDEFSGRLDRAYRATVRTELDAVVADLPARSDWAPGRRGVTRWWVSPLGGFRRRGHFQLPEHQIVLTMLGGMDIDLRGAELSGPVATLTAVTFFGGADVVVPPGVRVEVSGFSFLGGRDVRLSDRVPPDAPVVRVRLFSVVGRAKVRSKGRRERRT